MITWRSHGDRVKLDRKWYKESVMLGLVVVVLVVVVVVVLVVIV